MSDLRLLALHTAGLGAGRPADRIVELVAEHAPDLVCVHGAPHRLRWRQAVGALARRSGLVVVTGGGRGAGTALVMSTLGVDVAATLDVRFDGGGMRPPGAAVAALARSGAAFTAAAVQLTGNSAVRLEQAHRLAAALTDVAPGGRPVVISAEGVDRPGTAAWQQLAAGRTPVAGRVFVDQAITVAHAETLPGPAFTAPVLVDLAVPVG